MTSTELDLECGDLSPLLPGDLSPSNGLERENIPSRSTRLCLADKSAHLISVVELAR
jgi:hypothetical protein